MTRFGFETEAEEKLCFLGLGTYKGYKSIYCGCGTLIFWNGSEEIRQHRGIEVENWVADCWESIKKIIDEKAKELIE